jgi:hypothetical protein
MLSVIKNTLWFLVGEIDETVGAVVPVAEYSCSSLNLFHNFSRSLAAKYKSLKPFKIKLAEFVVRRWKWEKVGNLGRLFFALRTYSI